MKNLKDLKIHFQREDAIKDVLFNSTSELQEKRAREKMEVIKKEENKLFVN